MKMHKSNLDEMQEMKLLKIEHTGCWLAFWGLFVAVMVQNAFGNGGFQNVIGESSVFLVVSIYLLVASIKNGIWDRKLKADFKTNLLISMGTGGAVGVFWFAVSYYRYNDLVGSIVTLVCMMFFTAVLVMLLLTVTAGIYRKRKHQLDARADQEELEE